MSMRVSATALMQAGKELLLDWDQTKASWHDVKSREFEERFLSELPHHLGRSADVIAEIDALLRKVRSDCE